MADRDFVFTATDFTDPEPTGRDFTFTASDDTGSDTTGRDLGLRMAGSSDFSDFIGSGVCFFIFESSAAFLFLLIFKILTDCVLAFVTFVGFLLVFTDDDVEPYVCSLLLSVDVITFAESSQVDEFFGFFVASSLFDSFAVSVWVHVVPMSGVL